MSKKGKSTKSTLKQQSLQSIQQPVSSKQKAKSFLSSIEERLLEDIDQQEISIAKKKIPLIAKKTRRDISIKQLKRIENQKGKAVDRLSNLREEEKHYLAMYKKSKLNHSTRPKSELTQEDIKILEKLKQDHLQFQKDLQEKTKLFEEREKKYVLQEKELSEKRKKEKCEKRRENISQRLKQLTLRREQRQKKFEEEKQKMSKLLLDKRMHQKLEQKWQEFSKSEQKRKIKMHEERLKEKSVDFSKLRSHQKKYEEARQKFIAESEKKRIQLSRISQLTTLKVQKSKYHTMILEEQKKQRQKFLKERNDPIERRKRRNEYGKVIKQHYAPHQNKTESSEDQQQKTSQISRINRKSPEEIKNMGIRNLEYSKSKVAKQKKQPLDFSEHERIRVKNRYHDYLTDYRKNRNDESFQSSKKNLNYQNQINEVKKILKKTNYSEKQKLDKVRFMTERIDNDTNIKSSVLIKKIAAKLEIIQSIF